MKYLLATNHTSRLDIESFGMGTKSGTHPLGVIVATGTGSTGWARSINNAYGGSLSLPNPTDHKLAFFVREAFPSIHTGTSVCMGLCRPEKPIRIVSEMNNGGVIFGDGMENDAIQFNWGQTLDVGIAKKTLNLVVA